MHCRECQILPTSFLWIHPGQTFKYFHIGAANIIVTTAKIQCVHDKTVWFNSSDDKCCRRILTIYFYLYIAIFTVSGYFSALNYKYLNTENLNWNLIFTHSLSRHSKLLDCSKCNLQLSSVTFVFPEDNRITELLSSFCRALCLVTQHLLKNRQTLLPCYSIHEWVLCHMYSSCNPNGCSYISLKYYPDLPCPQPCLLRPRHMASKNCVKQSVLFMQI